MNKRQPSSRFFKAPFLRAITLDEKRVPQPDVFPFTIPAIAAEPFRIDFNTAVTILVGPNGSGKSTILESIAALCGFGRMGGNKNYRQPDANDEILSRYLVPSWKPKVTRGFFTRAETFHGFIQQVDQFANETGRDIYQAYGGKSLTERSHGEAYLSVFENRIRGEGVYILDEPEAALSPTRQIEFLRILRRAEKTDLTQFIVATHSPLLMAYPGATLLHLTDDGVIERPFQMTEHFRIMKEFYADPQGFMEAIFCDI